MNLEKLPNFFKHTINTRHYESKICPLGNVSAFAIAGWIFFRDIISKNSLRYNLKKTNLFIFSVVLILSFAMNLNAFIYFIPVFIYEFLYRNN